jgi:hypothetical protein
MYVVTSVKEIGTTPIEEINTNDEGKDSLAEYDSG